MLRDLKYEQDNTFYDTDNKIYLIKCKNNKLCNSGIQPDEFYIRGGNYLCYNCHMMFGSWDNTREGCTKSGKGNLTFQDNTECPICLEIKLGISYPNCHHSICIDCFTRCYYGDYSDEPQFPYPELEDEYYNDEDHPKWELNYPLIKEYHEKWNKWDDDRETKYEDQQYLRRCGICRK